MSLKIILKQATLKLESKSEPAKHARVDSPGKEHKTKFIRYENDFSNDNHISTAIAKKLIQPHADIDKQLHLSKDNHVVSITTSSAYKDLSKAKAAADELAKGGSHVVVQKDNDSYRLLTLRKAPSAEDTYGLRSADDDHRVRYTASGDSRESQLYNDTNRLTRDQAKKLTQPFKEIDKQLHLDNGNHVTSTSESAGYNDLKNAKKAANEYAKDGANVVVQKHEDGYRLVFLRTLTEEDVYNLRSTKGDHEVAYSIAAGKNTGDSNSYTEQNRISQSVADKLIEPNKDIDDQLHLGDDNHVVSVGTSSGYKELSNAKKAADEYARSGVAVAVQQTDDGYRLLFLRNDLSQEDIYNMRSASEGHEVLYAVDGEAVPASEQPLLSQI